SILNRIESSREGVGTMIQVKQIPKDYLQEKETTENEKQWTIENVHDPAIYKDGDWYYIFSTDAQITGQFKPGIQIRKSRDLLNWQWVGRAFSEIPKAAKEWTGAGGLWAPEIRSEEHTSELQSRFEIVCRLL